MSKHLSLTWVGEFETDGIYPLLQTLAFQKSFKRKQLGFNDLIYLAAHITRGETGLITWLKTRVLTDRLVKLGCIDEKTARDINIVGAVHDIGHGPNSHAIEFLTSINHEKNGARMFKNDEELRQASQQCGVDPDYIAECLKHKVPEFAIVDDKNFGTDKLVYLVMAGVDTGFGPDIGRAVDNILKYLYYDDEKMILDAKAVNSAMYIIQPTYNYFYKDLFLCKSAQIVQRFMQKVVYRMLTKRGGNLSEEALWQMTDNELMAEIIKSDDKFIQKTYEIYSRGMSAFPKTGLTIKLGSGFYLERAKEDTVFKGEKKEFFYKFAEACNPMWLSMVECRIACHFGIPNYGVVIPALTTQNLGRFKPQDILIKNSAAGLSNLRDYKPHHFASLEDSLNDFMAVRVCILPKYRKRLYKEWEDVYHIIEEVLRDH